MQYFTNSWIGDILNVRYMFIVKLTVWLELILSIDKSVRRLLMLKSVLYSLMVVALEGLQPNSAVRMPVLFYIRLWQWHKKTVVRCGRDHFKVLQMIPMWVIEVHYVFFFLFTVANTCQSNPCQNGGTCHNKIEAYSCSCTVGYSGVNCEQGGDFLRISWLN